MHRTFATTPAKRGAGCVGAYLAPARSPRLVAVLRQATTALTAPQNVHMTTGRIHAADGVGGQDEGPR